MRVNSEIHSVDKATHFHQKNHYLHAVPQKGNQYIILSSDLSSKLYPVLFHTVSCYIITCLLYTSDAADE